jgi:hypothetical protein
MKRRLPIGIQEFISIREDGFCYVDKTELVYAMVNGSGKAFFLSRPRRFGKSLLCSTLGAFFEGRRELFGSIAGYPALAVNDLDWEWKKHPVIKIDLNAGNYAEDAKNIKLILCNILENAARSFGISLRGELAVNQFENLIQDACEKYNQKVVVIVDEYDKPLLNTITAPDIHLKIRDELKAFYGVLKSADQYLRFVFLTGVTKFAHVSIFSDLNHLSDLTLDPRYAGICGITQEELERDFAPEINDVLRETDKEREAYIQELRRFYNGYRFTEKRLSVYNPFGLLKHFDQEGRFLPYWYDTGTPTFLVKLIAEQKIKITDLNKLRVGYADFSKYDIAGMRAEPLLYQSGYLTIANYDAELGEFALDYPNEEIRASFARSLLEQYLPAPEGDSTVLNADLARSFMRGKPDDALAAIRRFLSSIPYDLIQDKENYYQTAVHLIFTMLGLNCRSEVRIASGRVDALVETNNYVYCFEFKLDKTAEEALEQIGAKDYLLPWTGTSKKLFKIGVNFDSKKNNIEKWKIVCCE